MDVAQLDEYLLVGSVVVLLAVLAVRLSVRVGLPSLLLYLLMGVLLGEQFIGIRFDDADLAHALGFAALVVILLDGGITTKWTEIRPVLGWGLMLATVGVVVSVAIIARLADVDARGRHHLRYRRRRGVLGTARGTAHAPDARSARGRVRYQ
jgi:cell volume regulation protein A